MAAEWIVSMKQSFQSEWLALPPKEGKQVLEKINLLAQDPLPDAKVKKKLKYVGQDLYRLRAGDYRLFYTYETPYVSLLALRRRQDDTYDDDKLDDEFLGGFGGGTVAGPTATGRFKEPDWERLLAPKVERTPLPRPIDQELLRNLLVPPEYHKALLLVKDAEALLNCEGVPDEHPLRIHEALFERKAPEVVQQREFVVQEPDDLLRFKEGELLGFLLRLDAEQEKYAKWAVDASGPTLVKGAPGTGKSTVALYRARTMLQALRQQGREQPRLLFTTYTNALVLFSRQLLDGLLGKDAVAVDVRTADSLAMSVVTGQPNECHQMLSGPDLVRLLQQALGTASFEGNSLQKRAQSQTVARLGPEYLLEEVCSVIDARRLETIDAYLAAKRPGRRVPLSETQRKAIWAVRAAFHSLLDRNRVTTWQRLRGRAAVLVAEGKGPLPYDAIIVDEAQDIDPSLLQLLVTLCASPGRLFLTADANQSIYGSGFRWSDVHDSLKFRGRTGVLRVNHRSTAEIGEATASYLADGVLEAEDVERKYVNNGPVPAVRRVTSSADEVELLARFLPRAAREFHLGIAATAVLVPTEKAGKRIAQALQERGLDARFMTGKDLDLSARCVKVLTLQSSKGLEFPVVALAGQLDTPWPPLKSDSTPEERQERLGQARRTMFVAMSRAMRALLVLGPESSKAPLLDGFDERLWNLERVAQADSTH